MLPSIPTEIRYYVTSGGHAPFADWFEDLDLVARAKVTRAVARAGAGQLLNVKSVAKAYSNSASISGRDTGLFRARWRNVVILLTRDEEAPATRYRYGALILQDYKQGGRSLH